MKESPIIILASERSGTNLLRRLVANHSNVAGPVSPHLLQEFVPLASLYGDLSDGNNMRRLFEDMQGLANRPFSDWGIQTTYEEFVNRYDINCLADIFHGIYKEKARQEGKDRYCSKELASIKYATQLMTAYPGTKYLYLVRDPRDHVASWMKRPIALLSPFDAITKWIKEQEEVFMLKNIWNVPFLTVKYENLISDTSKTMGKVLNFIEEPLEKACFQTDPEKAKEANWNPHWQNLAKPVMKDNYNKFQKELETQDIEMIETLCEPIMKCLGYNTTTSCDWDMDSQYAKRIKHQRKMNRAKRFEDAAEQKEKLKDKERYVRNVRAKLPKEPTVVINNTSSSSSFVRNRLKFLAYAFLGVELTKSMASKIKRIAQ